MPSHLETFEKEDVPDPQKMLEGQRVGEGCDEPVGAVYTEDTYHRTAKLLAFSGCEHHSKQCGATGHK